MPASTANNDLPLNTTLKRAHELDAQGVALVGGHGGHYTVTAFLPDEVERAADAVHGLVEDDIVFEGIGTDQ